MAVQKQSDSQAGAYLVWALGAGLAVVALVFIGPLWVLPAALALGLAAAASPPPMLTGKKDDRGAPTAQTPEQVKKLRRHQKFRGHGKAVFGGKGLVPTKGIRLSFIASLGLGVFTLALPSSVDLPLWLRGVCALFAFLICVGFEREWASSKHPEDPYAGTMLLSPALKMGSPLIASSIVALALGVGVYFLTRQDWWYYRDGWQPWVGVVAGVGFMVFMFATLFALLTRKDPVAAHEEQIQARINWDNRWESLKSSPAPTLQSHVNDSVVIVDEFLAPIEAGSSSFLTSKGSSEVARVLGVPVVQVVGCPATFDGQLDYNTLDANLFRIIQFPLGYPDVCAADAKPETVALALQVALAQVASGMSGPNILVEHVEDISAEDAQTKSWNAIVHMPEGPGFGELRSSYQGMLSGILNCDVEVDHRAGVLLFGALHGVENFAANFPITPNNGVTIPEHIEHLAEEKVWDFRWAQIINTEEHAPTPKFHAQKVEKLATGQELTSLPFLTRQGMPPSKFTTPDFEATIATTLKGAPFVSITPYLERPGVVNAQAFSVVWSHKPLPTSPENVKPKGSGSHPRSGVATGAEMWLITAMVEKAFTAAKLPRPLVSRVSPLTTNNSPTHLWTAKLRLRNVSLEEVRKKITLLSGSLGTKWLRVAATNEEGVIEMFMGGDPSRAKLANPEKTSKMIASLDWEAAFSAANVVNFAGLVPTLSGVDHFPKNQEVQILQFDLPPSLSVQRVRVAMEKLRTNTGNEYLDIKQGPGGPATMTIYASRLDPMPKLASFDMDEIMRGIESRPPMVPFATAVTGEPVIWDPVADPHIKVIGKTGSGKSVGLQIPIFIFSLAGADVVIIDPTKKAADFEFARPYAKAIATDYFEAAGAIDLVYQEVRRRVNLNSKYKVGSINELPAEVRPKPLLLVIDEFTSLIGLDAEPKASSDMEVEQQRQEVIALNEAKQKIGSFSGKIGREARSAGVHLALGGQKLAVEDLAKVGARDLKGQMATLFVGKPKSQGEMMSALSAWELAPELGEVIPPGRGIWETGTTPPELAQVWFDSGKQSFFSGILENTRDRLPDEDFFDLTAYKRETKREALVEDVTISIPNTSEVEDLGTLEIDWDLELRVGAQPTDFDRVLEDFDWDQIIKLGSEPMSDEADVFDDEAFRADIATSALPIFDPQTLLILPGIGRNLIPGSSRLTIGDLPCEVALAGPCDDFPLWSEDLEREDLIHLSGKAAVQDWCMKHPVTQIYYGDVPALGLPGLREVEGPIDAHQVENMMWKQTPLAS